MGRKIFTGKSISSSGPYSHAVDADNLIFFSGQTAYNAIDYNGEKMDIATQTHRVFKHLQDVMEQAGVTLEQVVKVNVFITSMKHFKEMNAVYETYFKAPFPARTCVAVLELPLGADVEIEVIVRK